VKEKGLGDLLAALSNHPLRDHFHLTAVGDGPFLDSLRSQVAQSGLRETVTLAGRVGDDELAALWRGADLFVDPEWSQPAFGLVTLEAMGWGLPVLGTSTGATPEIATPECAVLVPPGRPDALGAALSELAGDPLRLRAMGATGRTRAETFTVDRMVTQTAAVYREPRASGFS
jgi:glycosyltransferase involved in cell wall biosynthesis